MELWIRSQDKEILTKYDCLSLKKYGVFPNHIIIAHIGNNIIDLGIYKTKERALEVLDEIQRILQPIIKSYTPLTESKEDYKNHCMKTELVGYETTYDIVALPTYVYEMPKE